MTYQGYLLGEKKKKLLKIESRSGCIETDTGYTGDAWLSVLKALYIYEYTYTV